MILYSDKIRAEYTLLELRRSHGHLLFRRQRTKWFYEGRPNIIDHNIDIFFYGVTFLNTGLLFWGINIEVIKKEARFLAGLTAKVDYPQTLFKLTDTEGLTCYIDAAGFKVFHNNYDVGIGYNHSILCDPTWSASNNLIYSSKNDVEAFRKTL